MSMAPLLGVPGKLKTILDRLTSVRAANLDNCDASVQTVDNNVDTLLTRLTSTRAGYIDNLNGLVASRLDANVSSVGTPALTRHADVNVSMSSASTGVANLGATFDHGKTVVTVTSSQGVYYKWWWISGTQIQFTPYSLSGSVQTITGTVKVTAVEFTQ